MPGTSGTVPTRGRQSARRAPRVIRVESLSSINCVVVAARARYRIVLERSYRSASHVRA
jgi:hypothetical protein